MISPSATAIVGVGIDLVDLDEIEESLARHGERYLRRVYTEQENAAWERACGAGTRRGLQWLAACFAVKEATLKVLRLGDEVVPWRCIEVRPDARSEHVVELSGAGAELAEWRGIDQIAASVEVTGAHAIAIVFGGVGTTPIRRRTYEPAH